MEGRGGSGDGADGIVTSWLGWMFGAIVYGGGAYWGKNPGMGRDCWKPFAGAAGGETGVEG